MALSRYLRSFIIKARQKARNIRFRNVRRHKIDWWRRFYNVVFVDVSGIIWDAKMQENFLFYGQMHSESVVPFCRAKIAFRNFWNMSTGDLIVHCLFKLFSSALKLSSLDSDDNYAHPTLIIENEKGEGYCHRCQDFHNRNLRCIIVRRHSYHSM